MQNFLGGYHISYGHFVWGTKYPDITYWDTKKWEAKCPMTPPLVGHRPQGAPPWLRNGLAVELYTFIAIAGRVNGSPA